MESAKLDFENNMNKIKSYFADQTRTIVPNTRENSDLQ